VRLGTFVRVFSASPFATRIGGKSTMARRGRRRQSGATGSFMAFWLREAPKPRPFCRISMRCSCAIWYCAPQSLCDRIPPVQDRASCLPESSGRALVADAREIRQHQMHPRSPLRSVTDLQSVALLSSSPGAALASVLRMQPLKVFPPQFSAPRSFIYGSRPGRHNRIHRAFSADLTFHFQLSTVNGRPPSK
jgi:hypothetical protein